MDFRDQERLSSVHKHMSSVRVTWLTTEERSSHNPWYTFDSITSDHHQLPAHE